jgi:hypothetical protein
MRSCMLSPQASSPVFGATHHVQALYLIEMGGLEWIQAAQLLREEAEMGEVGLAGHLLQVRLGPGCHVCSS